MEGMRRVVINDDRRRPAGCVTVGKHAAQGCHRVERNALILSAIQSEYRAVQGSADGDRVFRCQGALVADDPSILGDAGANFRVVCRI